MRAIRWAAVVIRFLYRFLRLWGDANAVARGRIGRRVGRRVYGRATGGVARRWFG